MLRTRRPLAVALAALLHAALAAPAAAQLPVTKDAPAPGVEIVAHRGESADAPENTLAAFRLAWARGVRTIELDVHLTRDGEAIVIHDADTRRTTGVPGLVRERTLAELRALDAGRWKGERWAGERLPTLAEALATIPDGGRCLVEIKVGPEAVPAVAAAIRASGKTPGQLAIIAFGLATAAEAKRQLPAVPVYLLSGFARDSATGAWTPPIDTLIARATGARLDALDLAAAGPLDADAVRRIRAAGLGLHVWTVDDSTVARRMAALGVDGITTNRAAWMRALLRVR